MNRGGSGRGGRGRARPLAAQAQVGSSNAWPKVGSATFQEPPPGFGERSSAVQDQGETARRPYQPPPRHLLLHQEQNQNTASARSQMTRPPPGFTAQTTQEQQQQIAKDNGSERRRVGQGQEMQQNIGQARTGVASGGIVGRPAPSRERSLGKRPINNAYVTRPGTIQTKKGVAGQVLNLSANYFRLFKKPEFDMVHYRVEFSPDVESMSIRKSLVREQREYLAGGYIFDGSSLFVTRRLASEFREFASKLVDGSVVKMTIKFVGQISMTDGQAMQVLNLILRKSMEGLNLQLVQRNFYDPAARIELRDFKLELWPVHNLMRKITDRSRDFKGEFAKAVLNSVVLTSYNNKTYRIDDIDWERNPSSTFQARDREMSLLQYYQERYNIKIRDPRQPLLVSKARARDLRGGQSDILWLVPELCQTTGLSDEMRADFRLMRAMSDHTRLTANRRIERLLAFNGRVSGAPRSMEVMRDWNMDLDRRLVEFQGRLLPQERIIFGNNKAITNGPEADWTRNLKGNKQYASVDLKRWGLIYPIKFQNQTKEFLQCLQSAGRNLQYQIDMPIREGLDNDRTSSYLTALDKIINKDPQLIMCIVPNNSSDRYSAIKKKCCIDCAMPTQVMLTKTIIPKREGDMGGVMSVATKVVLQLNCKLGGSPWMVDMPLSGLMTIGFDVYHDTSNRSRSYGAMVATMDLKQCVKYFSAVTAHTNGEELSNKLTENVITAIRCFWELHGCLPSKVLFYRDGVGDGQIEYVHSHEVMQVCKRLEVIYQSTGLEKGPATCYMLVNKRINTRIFNNGNNPGSGTVVDDAITLPERYDFFLISQTVRQGTVSPTSYNIIYDDMGLSADKLQRLTYKMCHLYFNWSGTTRVPAVCQYAHKLAFLVGEYIHQLPSNLLQKQLYFL